MPENNSINDRIAQLIAETPGAASDWKILEGFTSTVLVKDEFCFTWQPGFQLSFSTPGEYEQTASIELSETRATEILSSVCRQILQMCATGKFELDYLEEGDEEEEQDEYEDENDDELEQAPGRSTSVLIFAARVYEHPPISAATRMLVGVDRCSTRSGIVGIVA